MPKYMTKCEPVDKKPYIVYTNEKGILYSDDPNADIPGGGGGGEVETATLTVISNSDFATLSAPVAINVGAGIAYIASSPIANGTKTYTVLIGGIGSRVTIESSNPLQISVSGNIENAGATNSFIVTGDASITLTA